MAHVTDRAATLDKVLDVDSHEMIPAEFWPEAFGEEITERVLAVNMNILRENGDNTLIRPDIKGDLTTITAENVWTIKGCEAPGVIDFTRRNAVLDAMGIERQLVYPTFGLMGLILVYNANAPKFLQYDPTAVDSVALGRAVIAGHNEWAARVTRESGDRVRPVGIVVPDDVDQMVFDTASMIEAGVRAVMIPAGSPPAGTSPADPALDRFWGLLAEANVPVTVHVGTEFALFASSLWSNNVAMFRPSGHSSIELPFEPYRATMMHFSVDHYLTTMILGGVFERHPTLAFGAVELGAHWVGPLADRLELWFSQFRKRMTESLSLTPTEYIARNVRATPFCFEPVREYLERYPQLASVYCYSSDYPHREGGKYSKQLFMEQLDGVSDEVCSNFFQTNAELLLPMTRTGSTK